MKLLLLSNSTMSGQEYFAWAKPHTKSFLGNESLNIAFVPYAGVGLGFDKYEEVVSGVFDEMGHEITSLHHFNDPSNVLFDFDAVAVGGGNTFYLFRELHRLGLIDAIREFVRQGGPYIGWSAGSNAACPGLYTSNDMPIVQPKSFEGLHLIDFQINPHFTEIRLQDHGGESRLQRLDEFLKVNQDKSVVCLPEGAYIEIRGDKIIYHGPDGKLLKYSVKDQILKDGDLIAQVL